MNNLIDKFIELSIFHQESLKTNPANYKYNNKIAGKISKLWEKIETKEDFLMDYLYIIKNYPDLAWAIGIMLKKYDIDLSKKIYKYWYNIDKDKNWQWKYALLSWDDYTEDIKKIEKYKKWKQENKEEYEKIIKELNDIIDNY